MKNENAATVLKALKIRKVAKHSLRNGTEPKASLKPIRISFMPPPKLAHVRGTRWVSSLVERLGRKMAGTMASSMQTTPTQIDSVRVAVSAFSNHSGSYITTQNHGAMTHAHWPIHCATAMMLVRSWKSSLIS